VLGGELEVRPHFLEEHFLKKIAVTAMAEQARGEGEAMGY
jgi:hypothetical protein